MYLIGHHSEHISATLLYVRHIYDPFLSFFFGVEVIDQNFIDEDSEGEKANHVCKAKRRKTSVVLTSTNDQVMVSGKHYVCKKILGKTTLWLLCWNPHHEFLVVRSLLILESHIF